MTDYHLDLSSLVHVQPPSGLFHGVCHTPDNQLTSRIHRTKLILVQVKTDTLDMNETKGFEVVNNAERKFPWFGKEPGVLSPKLT